MRKPIHWLALGFVLIHGSAALGETPPPRRWAGIYPTVLTPFLAPSGGVDVPSLERQIRRVFYGGAHGLLVLGTFGEGAYITPGERAQVIATAVRLAGSAPMIVGIQTCDFETARDQLLQARDLGARAVLVQFLGRPRAPFAEVHGFYAALTELHTLPIFYDHYPSQTGLRLSAGEMEQILSLPGVVGIQESGIDVAEMKGHLRFCRPRHQAVFSSSTLQLAQFLDLGGQGFMCPEAVLEPAPVVQAYLAYEQGKQHEARCLQRQLSALTPLLRNQSKQGGLKCALAGLGVPTAPWVRCPAPPLTAKDQRAIQETVCHLKGMDWDEALRAAPEPLPGAGQKTAGGALLRTGAFQLGPGVARDLLRSQGDGLWGFPIP